MRRQAEDRIAIVFNGGEKRMTAVLMHIIRLMDLFRDRGRRGKDTADDAVFDTALTLLAAEIMERNDFAGEQREANGEAAS